MNQLPSEWSKQLTAWVKRQPRWMVVGGGLLLIALMVLLLADMQSPAAVAGAGDGGDPYLNSTALALGVFMRLILVVIAIFFAGVVLRRWQSGGGKAAVRQLAVLETLHLSQRRAVYLVRAGQQVFLLGATDQSINLLGQVTTTADGRPTAAQISFDQHLSIATQKTMDTPPGEE